MMVMMMMIAAVLMGVMGVISARRRLETLVTAEILMQMMETGRPVHCMESDLIEILISRKCFMQILNGNFDIYEIIDGSLRYTCGSI